MVTVYDTIPKSIKVEVYHRCNRGEFRLTDKYTKLEGSTIKESKIIVKQRDHSHTIKIHNI